MNAIPSGDGVRIELEPAELNLLRGLFGEYAELLENPAGDDPVIARLLPHTYEDAALQAQWEELAGGELLESKRTWLREAAQILESPLELDATTLERWLAVVNDLRLAIGTRIGIDEERMSAGPMPDDPEAHVLAVLHWLGWLQERVLEAAG